MPFQFRERKRISRLTHAIFKGRKRLIDLVIADTGNQITATINNSTTLTADVTNIARYGNVTAYYSREFGSGDQLIT